MQKVDIGELRPGVYILREEIGSGTRKLVVQ